jgi:hypothetical protein
MARRVEYHDCHIYRTIEREAVRNDSRPLMLRRKSVGIMVTQKGHEDRAKQVLVLY